MAATFQQFELERWMSVWEPRVRVNLCDSGAAPLSVDELLEMSGGDLREVGRTRLSYGEHNGSAQLRETIAALYPNTTIEHVLVTSGSAESMFLLCWLLIERGDRVVIPVPGYAQAWGIATNLGAEVVPLPLALDQDWEPDPSAIRAAITRDTRLVLLTNPHNPTGHLLSASTRDAIVERAAAVGAWLIVDEIYLGAELHGATPASMWGSADRLVVTNGLSKSYGLPGLRIGWTIGPPDLIAAAWARHDYTVLAPNIIGDQLALRALAARPQLQARARRIMGDNWPRLEQSLGRINAHLGDCLAWRAPHAGPIVFVRYDRPIDSQALATKLRDDWSVLIVPGDHFGVPNHVRIGIGKAPSDYQHDLDILEYALLIALG